MTPRDIEFEWSESKAASNLNQHGVGFDEAETAFDDQFAYIQEDELHSDDEPRELLIGYSNRNHLLLISFVQREHNRVRLISARPATKRERRIYEEASRF